MVKRIIWSKHALKDRLLILEYWTKRIGSKTYSRKLDQNLRKMIALLKTYPSLGMKFENSEIRFLISDDYQVFL